MIHTNTATKVLLVLSTAVFFIVHAPGRSEGAAGTKRKAPRPPARIIAKDSTVLAEVNGEKIRVSQLRDWMRKTDIRHSRSILGDKKAKDIAYRELINERLILQEMRAKGKDRSDEFRGRIGVASAIALGNLFHKEDIRGYVPGDNEVRALLPRYFQELSLRIFFGGTLAEAMNVRERVLGGEDFERLVREKSVGPGAEKGGVIAKYRPESYIPGYIEKEAFSSGEGYVSNVFETPLGYAFFRVEDTSDIPPEKIGAIAKEAEEEAREAAGRKTIEEATRKANVTIEDALARELDTADQSRWEEYYPKTVAEVDGEKVTVRDLYWFILVSGKQVSPRPGSGQVPALLRSFTTYLAVAGEARRRGMDRSPKFEEGIRKASEKILLELFPNDIARSVRVTDKEARQFFERNRDAFKRPPGRFVREVYTGDQQMAQTLLEQLRMRPEDIDRFANALDGAAGGGKGQVLYRERMDRADAQLVFGAPVGEIMGPYQRKNKWVLFVVDKEIPGDDDPSFEEYAGDAKSAALNEKTGLAIKGKVEELYRKATILTHTEVMETVEW